MILLTACKFDAVSICSVCAFFADMQRRAEKAKTLNSKQESARIPQHVKTRRDKKDAEASKIVTSAYKRTAEAIFGRRFFSLPAKGRDKIAWSVRFRRARRTSVRRAAKSGAEKAKTLNFKQKSVRIPTHLSAKLNILKINYHCLFSLFRPGRFNLPVIGR